MDNFILEINPDLIISTLPLSCQYMQAYRDIKGCKIPLFTFITDLDVHPDWINPYTDLYFVADRFTFCQLSAKGVPKEKIIVSGIPVRQSFYGGLENMAGMDSGRNVLIMGGGLGLIPSADNIFSLLDDIPDLDVTVVCGNNHKLYSYLKKYYPQFNILSFVKHPEIYLQKADLLLTKAGGVTIAEAIRTVTPMFVFQPFLLHEKKNADYVRNSGIGIIGDKLNTVAVEQLKNLLCNQDSLNKMKDNIKKVLLQYKGYNIDFYINGYVNQEASYAENFSEKTA